MSREHWGQRGATLLEVILFMGLVALLVLLFMSNRPYPIRTVTTGRLLSPPPTAVTAPMLLAYQVVRGTKMSDGSVIGNHLVANFPVKFAVGSGNADVNGSASVTVVTNAAGFALATLKPLTDGSGSLTITISSPGPPPASAFDFYSFEVDAP